MILVSNWLLIKLNLFQKKNTKFVFCINQDFNLILSHMATKIPYRLFYLVRLNKIFVMSLSTQNKSNIKREPFIRINLKLLQNKNS